MREEFNLDALPVHGLTGLDPEARVVNPARRELERQISRMRNRLGTLRNRAADLPRRPPSDTAASSRREAQPKLALHGQAEPDRADFVLLSH